MKKLSKIVIAFVTAALFIIPNFAFAADVSSTVGVEATAFSNNEAKNLSDQCVYQLGNSIIGNSSRLYDEYYETSYDVYNWNELSISWDDKVNVSFILVEFTRDPQEYEIKQFDKDDQLISARNGLDAMVNDIEYVSKETRKVSIVPKDTVTVCGLKAYDAGTLKDRHKWNPTPDKLDYLVVATHPDDDVIFLGAIIPTYTGEYGLVGSSLVMTSTSRIRRDEYLNGEWALGQRTAPLAARFPDIASSANAPANTSFNDDALTRYLVRIFRKYKPEVVFTQAQNGEYGHWQHRKISKCVFAAVPLASNENYDKDSIEQYGAWDVKKLYIHLYEENQIFIDVSVPLEAFARQTAFDVATEAFECHASQHTGRHWVKNEGVYSMTDFGLAYTSVGNDTYGVNNPFENTAVNNEKLQRNVFLQTFKTSAERLFKEMNSTNDDV